LGLGNIGPLAGKPVMEGKGCLFKKFAGIDVFDIEIDASDPDKIVDIVAALEPTFGGINLEDIKAPECFIIERKLRERMRIPVFHDDQHGTAITVAAAVLNGLKLVGKDIARIKAVASGAGAAALACLDLLVALGLRRDAVFVSDIKGVVYKGRTEEMDAEKARYAQDTKARTLGEIMGGADLFLGLSAGGVLKPEMVKAMADPLVFALANPSRKSGQSWRWRFAPTRSSVRAARLSQPGQCSSSFIFRGASMWARPPSTGMKLAAVRAIAELAQAEASDIVANAYGGQSIAFGRDYLIPRPFDPRLIERIAPAVAKAAMDSGVATRPLPSMEAYRERMARFAYHSGNSMKPVFEAAKASPKRVIYAEGEEERVLRAVQVIVDEGLARPVLVGRSEVIERRIKTLGLRLKLGDTCDVVNIPRPGYPDVVAEYQPGAPRCHRSHRKG
jgi:malate dehydrogenase (oxaloacetate-decarboxylating)(NADP+)